MNTAIVPFNYNGLVVRTVRHSNEVWFVAKDVCGVLGMGNVTKSLLRLDADEQALTTIQGLSRGNNQANIINESGLYHLILTSRKPEAKQFRRWVTGEVLPALRREGFYSSSPTTVKPKSDDREITALQRELITVQRELITKLQTKRIRTRSRTESRPKKRSKTWRLITPEEKKLIADLHKEGLKTSEIAHTLKRPQSSIQYQISIMFGSTNPNLFEEGDSNA